MFHENTRGDTIELKNVQMKCRIKEIKIKEKNNFEIILESKENPTELMDKNLELKEEEVEDYFKE